eukprot:GHRR01001422.1.p1 GENE.GHRR01001422.1~~GHRR01001422.1.p1  ORF type:complete len:307 (+),score=90.27 GHRR01001422.1:1674-2594(+)
MAGSRDSVATAIISAAERFCVSQNISPKEKRLLYEFLAYPGTNGKTLSGLHANKAEATAKATIDIVYITRKWFGVHIIKHYYIMRQYNDASHVVLEFLRFLRTEGTLPASLSKELDESVDIAQQGVKQLPGILKLIRQPCVRNEAYSRVYPLRPFPLCTVPPSTAVKNSSSRHWPASGEQGYRSWLSYASERCRVEVDELDAIVKDVPRKLVITAKHEGRWKVLSVNRDNSVVFKQLDTDKQFTIPFSAKRAADLLPGMVMIATLVTLSDGTMFATDWGYVYPTYYAPVMDHQVDFGPYGNVQLVH